MIKAAFFDFDSTLFSHITKCIPTSAKKSLELLREKGILVCLCTGRSLKELNEFPLDGVSFDYYVMMNGGTIYDNDLNVINETTITGKELEGVLKLFNEKKIGMSLTEKDDVYCNYYSDTMIKTMKEVSTDLFPIKEYTGNKVYQATVIVNQDELEYVKQNIGDCEIFSWHPHGFDIIAPGQSKANGLKTLCNKLNIKTDDCISFGDAQNDITMMKATGISVCMGNGDELTKKAASYITSDADEDGIYNALKHFNII